MSDIKITPRTIQKLSSECWQCPCCGKRMPPSYFKPDNEKACFHGECTLYTTCDDCSVKLRKLVDKL